MKLGVIGGLGPIATAYFYELVVKMTDANQDQDHLEMLIYSCPWIPDRTRYILKEDTNSPVEPMIAIGKRLVEQEVDYIAIPCITAHYFHEELERGIDVPIINLVKEVANYLKEQGIKKVGIAATDGTLTSALFQKELQFADIEYVIPSVQAQKDIMHLIYQNVKAGNPIEMDRFERFSTELRDNGAQIIILGCTELSMIKKEYPIGPGFLDCMELLAKRSIEACKKPLKESYQIIEKGRL